MVSFHTVRQFSERFPAWSEGSLRWLIFNATQNGLAESSALIRQGGRVLIDEERFIAWVRGNAQPGKGRRAAAPARRQSARHA
jgi:hypothetical protein